MLETFVLTLDGVQPSPQHGSYTDRPYPTLDGRLSTIILSAVRVLEMIVPFGDRSL
jgi:hypothetical protein